MHDIVLTLRTECSTGLVEARCPRPCGGLFFKFSTVDPAFYIQTKCRKCRRTVEILGTEYAIASVTTVR